MSPETREAFHHINNIYRIERYYSCSNPKCYERLQQEVEKKDSREVCILYLVLISVVIGLTMLCIILLKYSAEAM